MSDFPPGPDDFGPIKVLPFPEPMRLRPEMYVGGVRDGSGLHGMIDIVVDDALVRHSARVSVVALDDGSIVITDDGAAFPFAGPFRGRLAAKVIPRFRARSPKRF